MWCECVFQKQAVRGRYQCRIWDTLLSHPGIGWLGRGVLSFHQYSTPGRQTPQQRVEVVEGKPTMTRNNTLSFVIQLSMVSLLPPLYR